MSKITDQIARLFASCMDVRLSEAQQLADIIGNSPLMLQQAAVPVIIPPNGTVSTAGKLTLTAALPRAYDCAWVYLPAGAIVGGAAGFYWVKFGDTGMGGNNQVYTAYCSPLQPFYNLPPAGGLTNARGSGSAYTQSTSIISLASVTVPAGYMGLTGSLRIAAKLTYSNSANNKGFTLAFGAATIYTRTRTTTSMDNLNIQLCNRGVANAQIELTSQDSQNSPWGAAVAGAASYYNVDTSVDQQLKLNSQVAVAGTDFVVMEAITVELMPS